MYALYALDLAFFRAITLFFRLLGLLPAQKSPVPSKPLLFDRCSTSCWSWSCLVRFYSSNCMKAIDEPLIFAMHSFGRIRRRIEAFLRRRLSAEWLAETLAFRRGDRHVAETEIDRESDFLFHNLVISTTLATSTPVQCRRERKIAKLTVNSGHL